MKRLLPLLLVGFLARSALADIIHLKDGTQVEGVIHRGDDGYTVTTAGGSVTAVPLENVDSIEIKPASTPEASMQRLGSLRRAVENLSDIDLIIQRYESFLTQNAGSPAATAAQKDLDQWQDRQAKGLVKVGTRWVTPQEQAEIQQRAGGVADELRQTMKQGRLKEAAAVLDQALADSPTNISLLYLRGVLMYREEQLPPARKAFEAVFAQAADHAPTINNLAVILWRQNAFIAALNDYDAAMLAAPVSREILDNVAEALNALPANERKGPVVAKVIRHFTEQDEELQKKMAVRGLTRWGATWVTAAEADRLAAQEKEIQTQLDQMSHQFDALQARINAIDQTISQDQLEIQQIQSTSYARSSTGQVVQLPLPQRYYDLGNEITSLQAERPTRVAQQDQLRRDAKVEQQKLPVAKYTGIQKIIDVDGMPVMGPPPPPPTTDPTSQPAVQ
jgi:tetratricopeptide (TPR) repeat protein